MCPKSYKYVLRGGKQYLGDNNKATYITSDILPDEPELNCRVTNFILHEDGGNAYTTTSMEVRASFNQPLSLDTVSQGTSSATVVQSTTLCVVPNEGTPSLQNPTEKFVVSRPTNQLWEISIYDHAGTLLADCQSYYLELEFTKIDHD